MQGFFSLLFLSLSLSCVSINTSLDDKMPTKTKFNSSYVTNLLKILFCLFLLNTKLHVTWDLELETFFFCAAGSHQGHLK